MKEKYEKPTAEVIEIQCEEILTYSGAEGPQIINGTMGDGVSYD